MPLLPGNPPEYDRLVLARDRVREVLHTADPSDGLWLTAAHYFEHCFDPAPLTADDIFDVERPTGEGHRLYELLPRVAPSERTQEELPFLLEREDWETLAHRVVLGLVPKAAWLAQPEATPSLSLTVRRSVERVHELCALDFPKLWSEFVICAERWEPFAPGATYTAPDYVAWFHAFEMRREELTVALATHGARASAAACELLAGTRAGRGDPRFCAAMLLGQCPSDVALDPLLALLRQHPWHDLLWASVDALSRIGTAAVVRRAAECHRETRAPGLLAAISRVRRSEAESTLIDLLGEARDIAERAGIVDSLADLFPTEGFGEMLDVVLSAEYAALGDDGLVLEAVLDAAHVAGYQGPRLAAARALLRILYPPHPRVVTVN